MKWKIRFNNYYSNRTPRIQRKPKDNSHVAPMAIVTDMLPRWGKPFLMMNFFSTDILRLWRMFKVFNAFIKNGT